MGERLDWVTHGFANRLRCGFLCDSRVCLCVTHDVRWSTPVKAFVVVITSCDLLVYIVFVDTGTLTHPSTARCWLYIITDRVEGSDFSSVDEDMSVLGNARLIHTFCSVRRSLEWFSEGRF
jgi:hypothetical protein